MKPSLKLLLGLLVITLIGAVGYICGYRMGCDPVLHEAVQFKDSMTWLRHEFHLSPEQFDAIRKLHAEYSDTCDKHCSSIQAAISERAELEAAHPDDKAALALLDARIQNLRTNCETALAAHLEKVGALMSREDGARYLAMMRPLLAKFDHSGAPDLSFSKTTKPHIHHHE